MTSRIARDDDSVATVAAGMANGLVHFAVARGADRAALLSRSLVDAASLADDDGRIPFARYVALYQAVELLCQDPAVALHFGEALETMDQLVVCLIGSACETMADVLGVINRYGRLSVDVDTLGGGDPFQLEPVADGVWLVDASVYPGGVPHLTETSFTRLVVGTRQLTDRCFVRAVHFTRPAPARLAEYERIFRAPVHFGQRRNAMLLDPAWLSLRVAVGSAYAGNVLEAHARVLLDDLGPQKPWRRSVSSLLHARLASGRTAMHAVARELGTSRQTLYRRLKAEGLTFEGVLEETRRSVAIRLLGEGRSVAETAYRVGFSDPTAFSRAFKRWTGESPRTGYAGKERAPPARRR